MILILNFRNKVVFIFANTEVSFSTASCTSTTIADRNSKKK